MKSTAERQVSMVESPKFNSQKLSVERWCLVSNKERGIRRLVTGYHVAVRERRVVCFIVTM